MSARRFAIVVSCVGVCLISLLILWAARPSARTPTGGLSVTFAGLTNDASGATLVQFNVANSFSRRVRFGVEEVQIRQTNGWPSTGRVAGGADWLTVAAGANRVFSVPAPSLEGATWRVPLIYQQDLSFVDNVRFRIDLLAWGISRWRPWNRAPVRHGDGFHRTLHTYGPELGRGVEPNASANGSRLIRSERNQMSSAVGSRS
jgi:hypothetical protein